MVGFSPIRRYGPIGVDIGSHSIKLMQFSGDRIRVVDAVRWDLPAHKNDNPIQHTAIVTEAIKRALEDRKFRGRNAVFSLGASDLFVQNIRVPTATGDELKQIIQTEAASRLPFNSQESELRFIEADNVRQGDTIRREVILMACHRPSLDGLLGISKATGLRPVAIDVEPAALLRCYSRQLRRDEDQQQCVMFVNIGASTTTVVIARGSDAKFIKYIKVGGNQFDDAVAKNLKMKKADAVALRRHNGDRRSDQRDPEIAQDISESIRPVMDQLATELSMCIRYYSVTFRGQPLSRIVFSGGETADGLVDWLSNSLNLSCQLGDPLRNYEKPHIPGRVGQWDIVTGLALREVH